MLAINTAFMTANLALKAPNGQIDLKDIDAKSKHSENVLKTIDLMCEQAGISVTDLKTLAVVVGPGSFTGLRIGTAIAKALYCVENNLKLIAISSLELMAYIASKKKLVDGNFVCVINALSNLFFVCKFDKNGIKISNEQMIEKAEFDLIKEDKVVLKGDLPFGDFVEIEITGQDFLDFALLKESKKEFVSEQNLVPVYLRLSQAEDMLAKKSKKE